MYIYIYIKRERDKERERKRERKKQCMHRKTHIKYIGKDDLYIYIYIGKHQLYIHRKCDFYIYIYRERESGEKTTYIHTTRGETAYNKEYAAKIHTNKLFQRL